MMRAQLADIRERGEPIAALWASEETIYGRFGYGLAAQDVMIRARARRRRAAAGPAGRDRHDAARRARRGAARLPADLRPRPPRAARVHLALEGLVGAPQARRPPRAAPWRRRAEPRPARDRRQAGRLCDSTGSRSSGTRRRTRARCTCSRRSATRRSRCGSSGATSSRSTGWPRSSATLLSADHPLFLLVQRPNSLNWKVFDGLWLRLVDVGAALSARVDGERRPRHVRRRRRPDLPRQRRRLDGGRRRARRSQRRADVRLDVQALACAYLGGFTFAELARAGRVEEVARGGIARADALYRVDRKPWCPEIF